MAYADWVPQEAIAAWEATILPGLEMRASSEVGNIDKASIHPDDRHQVKLLTMSAFRCRSAIEKIPLLFSEFDNGKSLENLWREVESNEHYTSWSFISAVSSAYIGPFLVTELMTSAERSAWSIKVKKKSSELRALVGSSRYNNLMDKHFMSLSERVCSVLGSLGESVPSDVRNSIVQIFSDAPLLSTLLVEVENTEEDEILDWIELKYAIPPKDIFQKKPNDPDAHRAYFLRSMTNFFGENTGEPKRGLSLTLNGCLFGEIDKRKIVDIAPWLNVEK